MKKHLLLFIISFITVVLSAQDSTIGNLIERAKNSDKYAMVKLYNPTCAHCNKLKIALAVDTVQKFLHEKFVVYNLDFEHKSGNESDFLDQYKLKIKGVPLLLFFNSRGELVFQDNPSPNTKEIMLSLKKAITPYYQFTNIKELYNKGDRSVKNLVAYSKMEQLKGNDSMVNIIANDLFLSYQLKDSLLQKKSYIILKTLVYDSDNGFFQFWKTQDTSVLKTLNISHIDWKETLNKILYSSCDYTKKPFLSFDKIQRIKKDFKELKINEEPDKLFWQEELKYYLKDNKIQEASVLAEKMLYLEKYNPTSTNYYIVTYISLFPKSAAPTLRSWISKLNENAKTDYDKNIIVGLNSTLDIKLKEDK